MITSIVIMSCRSQCTNGSGGLNHFCHLKKGQSWNPGSSVLSRLFALRHFTVTFYDSLGDSALAAIMTTACPCTVLPDCLIICWWQAILLCDDCNTSRPETPSKTSWLWASGIAINHAAKWPVELRDINKLWSDQEGQLAHGQAVVLSFVDKSDCSQNKREVPHGHWSYC